MNTIPLTVTPIPGSGDDMLTWETVPGVGVYRLQRDGKWVSSSFDATKTSWRVKRGQTYLLRAYGSVVAEGSHPPTGLQVAPPVGPFTVQVGALFLRRTDNVTTRKVNVASSPDYGIGNMVWPPQDGQGTWTLEDCIAENVSASPPRSMDGRGEAGFWIGQHTVARRLRASRCAWMGMQTCAWVDGSDIGDIELADMPHIGLYCEHVTSNVHFHDFEITMAPGSDGPGVNVEWWYGAPNGAIPEYLARFPQWKRAGSYGNTFSNFEVTVQPGKPSFVLDAGTFGCLIHHCKINGPIEHPKNLMDPSRPNVIDWPSIEFVGSGPREIIHDRPIGPA